MAKRNTLTINQRLKIAIALWEEIKDSYPRDGYQTIEENLKADEEFLEDFFGFIHIVKAARKRNYINRDKALDIITSISRYPFSNFLDAIPDEGIVVDDEIYLKK